MVVNKYISLILLVNVDKFKPVPWILWFKEGFISWGFPVAFGGNLLKFPPGFEQKFLPGGQISTLCGWRSRTWISREVSHHNGGHLWHLMAVGGDEWWAFIGGLPQPKKWLLSITQNMRKQVEPLKRSLSYMYMLFMFFLLVEELAFSITLLQAIKAMGCCLFDYVWKYRWYGLSSSILEKTLLTSSDFKRLCKVGPTTSYKWSEITLARMIFFTPVKPM